MDENPLVGEPGSFILSKSNNIPDAVNPPASSQNKSTLTSATTPAPARPKIDTAIPPPIVRKGSKGGEKSPTTPGTKGKKERRKSKAAAATVTTTPK